MLVLPASHADFTQARFLMVFPIFRMFFMLILLVWLTGWVIEQYEKYGINYVFLLEIDPQCDVRASSMYAIASIGTWLWLACFALFLLDFKFEMFLYKILDQSDRPESFQDTVSGQNNESPSLVSGSKLLRSTHLLYLTRGCAAHVFC